MGDDVYHNGAFMLAANLGFYSSFVPRADGPEPPPRRENSFDPGTPDAYEFYLRMGPLATANARLLGGRAGYWQEIVDHTTYDDFWKRRSVWKFMKNVRCAVLNVGGWFDAEDPLGPLRVYRAVEEFNPGTVNLLVMGPWAHGGWARADGDRLGNLNFAVKSGEFFRERIQFPFFMRHLKDRPAALTPGKPAHIMFEMPDVYHAFRRGHRVMVQVQSSWFPLVDRNPQKFMEIPKASGSDFRKATQRVYRSRVLSSSVTLSVEQGSPRTLRPAR